MHAEALIEIGLLPPPLSPTPLSPPFKGGEVIGARLPPLPLREEIKGWVKRPARYALYFLFAALLPPILLTATAHAQTAPAGPSPLQFAADTLSGSAAPGARQPLSLSLQMLVLMTLLSVLPAVLLMMTDRKSTRLNSSH